MFCQVGYRTCLHGSSMARSVTRTETGTALLLLHACRLCACLMLASTRTLLHYRWFKFFFQITWKMLNSSRMTAARLHSLRCIRSPSRYFSALVIPNITNEPFLHYAPGSLERRRVLEACKSAREECPEIPLVINGKAVRTGDISRQVFLTCDNCCAKWGFPPPSPPHPRLLPHTYTHIHTHFSHSCAGYAQ